MVGPANKEQNPKNYKKIEACRFCVLRRVTRPRNSGMSLIFAMDSEISQAFADNETNISIDALFIVAQHDGCKWADECRHVKDLCKATRAET